MSFWKKGEDPWDIDPEKRKREQTMTFQTEGLDAPETEETETLLSELVGAFKKKPVEEKPEEQEPPMVCPWCGKEMERGFLVGGKGVFWCRGVPNAKKLWLGAGRDNQIRIDTEGAVATYQNAWYCASCRKLAADVPEEKNEFDTGWDGNLPTHPGTDGETEA